ncbi:hypothetical protein BD779DRAFT_410192 [Infundibulicybe gibba]|nr:hypothetical protein BD779DRAFT_410192 [Infundibulicybe gibba]
MASVLSLPKMNVPEKSTPATQQRSWEEINDILYPRTINEDEVIWRDRYTFFHERGWELRPRYRPDWKPSWLGTSRKPANCEDSIYKLAPIMILDAKSVANGVAVCLKGITRKTKEIEIGCFLSSTELVRDPNNHCVPILDAFRDPVSPNIEYIVMPLLRPFDDPSFWFVGETIDFITQTIEGLAFMHSHRVFHGDLTGANIMMDARPILPDGWHPVMLDTSTDGFSVLKPLARIDHPVRYYIIDYDSSIRLLPNESHFINDLGGQDQEVPELSLNKPIDVFKLDVFTLGNVFFKDFYQKYSGLDSN